MNLVIVTQYAVSIGKGRASIGQSLLSDHRTEISKIHCSIFLLHYQRSTLYLYIKKKEGGPQINRAIKLPYVCASCEDTV